MTAWQEYGPIQFANTGLFWVVVPTAQAGDTISVEWGTREPRVLLNGTEAEYYVRCEHERDMVGCPACFNRSREQSALGDAGGTGTPWRPHGGEWGILGDEDEGR